MKTVKKLPLLVALLCLMCTAAHAASEDYVYISSGEYYDTQARTFVYVISQLQNREVYSNVPNGAVTTETVSVIVDDALTVELYRDGVLVSDADLTSITEPGGYTVSIIGSNTSYQPVSFQIVSSVTGLLDEYTMPKGFSVNGVTLNGEKQNYSARSVELKDEGDYVIDYSCTLTGEEYRLMVTIDHTPPTLTLSNVNENGIAKGPVDISDVEEGAVIYVLHDGKEVSAVGNKLNETGDYHIILTDAAGNTSEYVFRIGVYFNAAAIISFLLLAAAITAMCLYLSRERKKMRVR